MVVMTTGTLIKQSRSKGNKCACFGEVEILNKYPISRNILIILIIIINAYISYGASKTIEANIITLLLAVSSALLIEILHMARKYKRLEREL